MIFTKKYVTRFLLFLLAGGMIMTGCTRKKAGITNRIYHQTTARFNGYFNAKEMMLAMEDNLQETHQENWDELLPIFIYPDEERAQSLYPELDIMIEKCSKVINRHSMRIRNKEHNKWIDDNYFLIGKANFYKRTYGSSQEMFTYVSKAFKNQESRYDAGVWLARVYMETDRMSKANTVLKRLSEEADLPKHIEAELPAVYADYYIRQENWDSAIEEVNRAIELSNDKDFRIRLTFILGQLYDKKGDSERAVRTFALIPRMAPPYEMEFNAKLYQAYAHGSRMDAEEVRKLLRRMLRDVKNYEYRDQVYYAMADVELKHNDVPMGIEYLIQSGLVSSNPKQKAKSYGRLADLYFEQRQYIFARNYYDSTLAVISEEMPDYEMIKAKAESLTDLVDHIMNVELQDSLIMMVNLPEKEREKKILVMMADMEAEEERRRKAMESGQIGGFTQQDQQMGGMRPPGMGGGGDWYFYNNTTRSHGFNEFRRVWGNRPLEDDWRRGNKKSDGGDWDEDAEFDAANSEGGGFVSSVLSLEEYIAGLPMDDSSLVASHYSLIESQYKMGVIYKERLQDDDNAIEAFTRIILEYDTSEYALTSLYQLYRLYVKKEGSGTFFGSGKRDNSDYYKYAILDDYPDSEYAKLILNPNYGQEASKRLAEDQSLYESTYTQYRRRQYNDALYTCNSVINEQPDNYFMAKFYLLKVLVIAQKKDATSYKNTLHEIIELFPGTDEAEKAKELLGAIGESLRAPVKEEKEEEEKPAEEEEKKPSPYVFDEKASHFFAVVFPSKGADANVLKSSIADFNSQFFRNNDIKVTNSFINADNQILILRSFSNVEEAMDYYNTFVKNNTVLKDINSAGHDRFVISTKNFTTLFKEKDVPVYLEFYDENYLKSK